MNFIFGDPELISQAFYPILAISLILNGVVCAIVYKAFGVNKWLVLGAGVLMLIASATFSSFNLSTIFYQLSVQDKTLNLYFAFPYRQSRQLAFTEVRYADAITPEAKTDNCHVVIEDKTGMLYQSLDLHSRECQQIQQQLMQTLHLSPRPLPKKSMHSPPVPQQ